MRFLLTAVNAKYIHSNLGVYSLKAYAEKQKDHCAPDGWKQTRRSEIEIGEYTINQQTDEILKDIFLRKPDVVGFSCYIWNITYIRQILRNLKKVLPDTDIWLGGPEVSYDSEKILAEEPAVRGIMAGEGEKTFAWLVKIYEESGTDISLCTVGGKDSVVPDDEQLARIPGIVFRDSSGRMVTTGPAELLSLDELPFPYENLENWDHRIIYYESSRGCPFQCSYCLSSIDKTVRFRSLELVKRELDFFLDKRVPQVKFVDRTFNCSKSHALAIWKYLLVHDNGVTNFHFEISADLIDEEQLTVMEQMRSGLIQLEIGVQTTYEPAIREIRRAMNLERLREAVGRIKKFGNIHQHLDLIAGLPCENLERFRQSFDEVYDMEPDQLQLGFLKVLKGSYIAEMTSEYDMVFHEEPPYEVMATRWLSYKDVLKLKSVEEMVEVYYNSGQFALTLKAMRQEHPSAFRMFEELADFYEDQGLNGVRHSRLARYEILYRFLCERPGREIDLFPGEKGASLSYQTPDARNQRQERYRDLLICDLYLRENVKSRPSFARDLGSYKQKIREFFREEKECPRYLRGYEAYDARQIASIAHLEIMGDGSAILFDYLRRSPLSHNARVVRIDEQRWKEC